MPEDPGKGKQAYRTCPQPRRLDFEVKDQDFQVENEPPEDGDQIRGPYICLSITNMRDCIQIL